MDNMEIFNAVMTTPKEARKPIIGGKLKGMTDINPMWRFKKLTEVFGPCGVGWKYTVNRVWTETPKENEICAFAEVSLYYKHGEQWSEAIPGIGGSRQLTVNKNGPEASDECYKMAITDAISVCCKALGMSADIYFEKDRDKYTMNDDAAPQQRPAAPAAQQTRSYRCMRCGRDVPENVAGYSYKTFKQVMCLDCQKLARQPANASA